MIEVYEATKHEVELKKWLNQWKLSHNIIDILPTTGWIIDNVAALFVYETNSKMCFIECLISNKDLHKEITTHALDILVESAIINMRKKGFKYIGANSTYESVIERAKKHGFTVNSENYKYFMRSI
jgi:hypothetical protein